MTTTKALMLALACVAALAACRSATGRPFEWTAEYAWERPRSHPALREGSGIHVRYIRNISPPMADVFVFADGRAGYVKTLDELRPLVRPIEDAKIATAYLELLRQVEIERDATLEALWTSRVLDFDEKSTEAGRSGEFTAVDAARWGIPKEPEVAVTSSGVAITRPLIFERRVIEWTRETVGRDGSYRREVLRVLEPEETVRRYLPMLPL